MNEYISYQVIASHPAKGSKWDWAEPHEVKVKFEDNWPNKTGFVCMADELGMSSIIDCQDEERAIELWLTEHGMTMKEATAT